MRCLLALPLLFIAAALPHQQHDFSDTVSRQIALSIKIKLVQNISMISNQTFAKQLLDDLFQDDDSKRVLTSIPVPASLEIFRIFNLQPPRCDQNNDGIITGPELKCFNKIWRYYIPGNEFY